MRNNEPFEHVAETNITKVQFVVGQQHMTLVTEHKDFFSGWRLALMLSGTSHYNLFCTVAQTGQFLDVLHRPGNVHDSKDAHELTVDIDNFAISPMIVDGEG